MNKNTRKYDSEEYIQQEVRLMTEIDTEESIQCDKDLRSAFNKMANGVPFKLLSNEEQEYYQEYCDSLDK